jgi:hypothetical protein
MEPGNRYRISPVRILVELPVRIAIFAFVCQVRQFDGDGWLEIVLTNNGGLLVAYAPAVASAVTGVWRAREDRYSELRTGETAKAPKIEMSYIGG